MEKGKEKKQPRKAPYQAPVLKPIDLRAEEVLGFGCKLPVGGNGPGAPCNALTCATDAGS